MRGLNKVSLIGNLGKDPEVRKLENNTSVAKITIATTEAFTSDAGVSKTHTEWHTVVLWRGLADLAEKYLHKGSLVYIEGKLRTRGYDDKAGHKTYVTEVIADQLILLDKAPPA